MPERRLGGSAARRLDTLRRVVANLRRIAGMPDYEAYVRHLRRCHPSRPIPSEREYFDRYLEERYGNGPTRCC
jgi:uncharacterized short protein YbdD (DUF466 family)